MGHFLRKWSPYFRIKKFRDNLNKVIELGFWDIIRILIIWTLTSMSIIYLWPWLSIQKRKIAIIQGHNSKTFCQFFYTKVRWIFYFRGRLNTNGNHLRFDFEIKKLFWSENNAKNRHFCEKWRKKNWEVQKKI